jgi:hypothetical protein
MRKLHNFRTLMSSDLCNLCISPMLRVISQSWHWRAMEKKDVRIQLVISPSEVEALDAWRAEHRIWSRSEAIRQLIADGVKPRSDPPSDEAR